MKESALNSIYFLLFLWCLSYLKICKSVKYFLKILHVVLKEISVELLLIEGGVYVFKVRTQSRGSLTCIH